MTYPESSLFRMDKEDEGKPLGDAWLMERKGEKIRHDRDNVFKRKKMTRSSRKKSGGGAGNVQERQWESLFSDLQILGSAHRENPRKACYSYI